jgi:hypothetical protein
MTVPTVATYSVASLVAAHTALRDLIDAGTGAGFLRLRSSAGVLLAELTLTEPAGTVSGTTGRLTLTASGPADALATGTLAYGEFCDSAGLVHLALPAALGAAPATGAIVVNSLAILQGAPVELISATAG